MAKVSLQTHVTFLRNAHHSLLLIQRKLSPSITLGVLQGIACDGGVPGWFVSCTELVASSVPSAHLEEKLNTVQVQSQCLSVAGAAYDVSIGHGPDHMFEGFTE